MNLHIPKSPPLEAGFALPNTPLPEAGYAPKKPPVGFASSTGLAPNIPPPIGFGEAGIAPNILPDGFVEELESETLGAIGTINYDFYPLLLLLSNDASI